MPAGVREGSAALSLQVTQSSLRCQEMKGWLLFLLCGTFSATGGDGSGSLGAPAAQRVLLCFWGWTSAPHPGPPAQPCSGTCSPHSRCDCGDVPSERQMCVTIITGQEMHPQGLRECTEINPALRATSSGAQLRLLPSVPNRISPAMKMNPFLLCG